MNVSVIIRTKNEAEFLQETLKRVTEQEFYGDYEIIIVDSGSTDLTLDIVRQFDIKLIEIPDEEFTYGRSLNIGARHAEGQLLVNLSAHAWPLDKKWLTNLLADFKNHHVAAVYGRQVSNVELNPFEALQNELFFGDKKMTFDPKNKGALKNIHFSNSNSAIRKDVWETFKFNEIVPYAEDLLWQRQVCDEGYFIVYAPDAVVYHTHRLNILNEYKNSRDCSYSLSLACQKTQSMSLFFFDAGIFLIISIKALFQNLLNIWKKRHLKSLKILPPYMLSKQLGWLVGRTKYRLKK
jgi:rhamnosyltransferase